MNSRERFLKACKGEEVDRPPVWIMRQAGRYLPEYRSLKARHSFKEFCRKPHLAKEVAMQPLKRFKLDAAILFSDILVVPEAMGLSVDYEQGGPVISPVIQTPEALNALIGGDVEQSLSYVGDALEAIREGVGDDLALIGFAGAPYTLASYMIAGRGQQRESAIKKMAFQNPDLLEQLLDRLADVVLRYLRMQVSRGADVVQLFDTWAGELSPASYRKFELPRMQHIIKGLSDLDVPVIYYINGVAGLINEVGEIGHCVQSIDWRMNLSKAREQLGSRMALQGNLDPMELYGDPMQVRKRVREMYSELDGKGHIFNLGHGVFPDTPIAGVEAFVDEVCKLGDNG